MNQQPSDEKSVEERQLKLHKRATKSTRSSATPPRHK